MTPAQKIELRRSEIRERLAAIAALTGDDVTDAITTERDGLLNELRDSEGQLRAAIESEATEDRQRGEQANGDGQSAELRALRERVHLGAYLNEASSGNPINDSTAEAEYREAVVPGLGHGRFPLELLAPDEHRADEHRADEHRADAATSIGSQAVPAMAATWLDRVFASTDAMFLGARFESVEMGDSLFPVISAGAAGAAGAAGTATDATAATIAVNSLKPLELRARYLYSRVDDIRLPGLEDALRRDLAGALGEGLDAMVFTGDGLATEPSGLLTSLTAPSDPANVVTWATAVSAMGSAVDGRYAGNLMDVAAVVGAATYHLMSGLVTANSGIDAAAQYISERTRGLRVSVHIPDAASNIQQAVVAKLGRGMGSLVVPVWNAVELMRDPYGLAGAPSGQVALTAVAHYNAKVIRPAAFASQKFKLA